LSCTGSPVEEDGEQRARPQRGELRVGAEGAVGLSAVHDAEQVLAGVAGEEAVAAKVAEHGGGAVGQDVGEAVVVVGAGAVAAVAEGVEEEAGEQAQAGAQLQDDQFLG
jgi:hypothetical protein